MDRQNLILIVKEHLEKEGNGVYFHLADKSELLINIMPKFFSLHMRVKKQYAINSDIVTEIVCIPYTSVLYVTLTNSENLKIIANQYSRIRPNDLNDDEIEQLYSDLEIV